MEFPGPTFWQNFWPNFWADLIVGIVIAGLISWVLARSKKIETKVLAEIQRLSESEYRLLFRLRNTGRVAFKGEELYWHLFVDNELQLEDIKGPSIQPAQAKVMIQGKPFLTFRSLLSLPVFPGRQTDLLELKAKTSQIEQIRLYYFLSTAYGLFPKHVRIDSDSNVSPESLGVVEMRLN